MERHGPPICTTSLIVFEGAGCGGIINKHDRLTPNLFCSSSGSACSPSSTPGDRCGCAQSCRRPGSRSTSRSASRSTDSSSTRAASGACSTWCSARSLASGTTRVVGLHRFYPCSFLFAPTSFCYGSFVLIHAGGSTSYESSYYAFLKYLVCMHICYRALGLPQLCAGNADWPHRCVVSKFSSTVSVVNLIFMNTQTSVKHPLSLCRRVLLFRASQRGNCFRFIQRFKLGMGAQLWSCARSCRHSQR